MVSSSQIIVDIIKSQESSVSEFCKKNGLRYDNFSTRIKANRWSLETLKKLSNILKVDLTSLATDKTRYLEEL